MQKELRNRAKGIMILLALFLCQLAIAETAAGDFTITDANSTNYYEYDNGVLTVKNGATLTIANTNPETATSNRIVIAAGATVTVTLKGVNISSGVNSNAPFHAKEATKVTLILTEENTITATDQSPAVWAPEGNGSELVIEGTGKLTAQGAEHWPGIGINQASEASSKITINGGTVTATGGDNTAGIGASNGSGGYQGTITINGGTVTATEGSNAYGIGGGKYSNLKSGTFTATGNAFIQASSIQDQSSKGSWSGVIFEENSGKVYGTPTLGTDATIPSGKTLAIESGKTLVIGDKVTLTIDGTCSNSGKVLLYKDGKIAGTNSGGITTAIAIKLSFDKNATVEVSDLPADKYIKTGTAPNAAPTQTPTRTGYTFIGWSESNTGTTAISDWSTTLSADKTYYAIWKRNASIAFSPTSYSYVYGSTAPTVSATVTGDDPKENISYTYYMEANCETKTTAANSGALSEGAAPKWAGTYHVKASYPEDDKNMSATTETAASYTITAKELTVTLSSPITKVYDGTTTVTSSPAFTLDGVVSVETVSLTAPTLLYSDNNVGGAIALTGASFSFSGDANVTKNYSLTQPTLTGAITAKPLTVTPDAGQTVYNGETNESYVPTFTISAAVGSEQPAHSGKLSWDSSAGTYQIGTLVPADATDGSGFRASNYTFALASNPGAITIESGTLQAAYATAAAEMTQNITGDWAKDNITLTAPIGFKIKAVSDLRAATGWESSLTLEQEGEYVFEYQLLRDRRTVPSDHSVNIKLDKTAPVLAGDPVINKLEAVFTLTDAGSGVASYSYSLDGGAEVSKTLATPAVSTSFALSASAGAHSLALTAKDAAGNELPTTVTFELKNDTPPPYVPTYYNVTIPAVVGASTTPGAGTYAVEEGYNFLFSLVLDAAYSESVPVVKAGGTLIAPRESDGKYILRNIQATTDVTIEGIRMNTSVANEAITPGGLRVWAAAGTLHIHAPLPARASIVTFDGRPVRIADLAAGDNLFSLPAGVYVVRIGKEVFKVRL